MRLVEESLELAGLVLLVVAIAWGVGVAVPPPWSWPAGIAVGGVLSLLVGQLVYAARTGGRRR